MKKLMIAAVVAVLGIAANAAPVNWSTGSKTNGFADPDGNTMKNNEDYTVIAYFYSDAAGTDLLATCNGPAKGAPNGGYSGITTYDFAANSDYYAKVVVTGPAYTRESTIEKFTTPGTGSASLSFYTGAGFATTGNKFGDWTPVPEPTSALLMLLGMAGLALKRKQA